MEREQVEFWSNGLDRPGALIRYGHFGRPVLAFPSEAGRAWDYENNGMVEALRPLIDEGRIKLYCVDSFDHLSWAQNDLPTEARAQQHGYYENFIYEHVVPTIEADSPGHHGIITTGCSMGGYHAVNFGLKRPDLFPIAISLSGNFDPSSWNGWGEVGEATYFANPTAYVANMTGSHLDWVRRHANIVLVVGQGPFEVHPTKSLPGANLMAGVLADKDIRHELDVWGHDSAHDWPWWRKQVAHHLSRFA